MIIKFKNNTIRDSNNFKLKKDKYHIIIEIPKNILKQSR